MKKLIIALSVATLTVSAFAMSKTPADASACGADKTCAVKEAASCCTTDGSCKTDAAKACPACTAAGGMCEACKAKAEAKKAACTVEKAAKENAECVGGVCPLKK